MSADITCTYQQACVGVALMHRVSGNNTFSKDAIEYTVTMKVGQRGPFDF